MRVSAEIFGGEVGDPGAGDVRAAQVDDAAAQRDAAGQWGCVEKNSVATFQTVEPTASLVITDVADGCP